MTGIARPLFGTDGVVLCIFFLKTYEDFYMHYRRLSDCLTKATSSCDHVTTGILSNNLIKMIAHLRSSQTKTDKFTENYIRGMKPENTEVTCRLFYSCSPNDQLIAKNIFI